jgi:hypothetical protein
MVVRFTLLAARDAPAETAHGVARYRNAVNGADLVLRAHENGVEDLLMLREPPARRSASYVVDVGNVAGLRWVSRSLEFLDAGGVPRLRVAPPAIVDAHGAVIEATLGLSGCAYDANPAPPWGRPTIPPGTRTCELSVTWDEPAGFAYPAVLDPAWTLTSNSMAVARKWFQAVRLTDGRVLVAGGTTASGATDAAEIFDPVSGTWSMIRSMNVRRSYFAAAPLSASRAFATGGASGSGNESSAEIFDGGSWTSVDPMGAVRQLHAAVTLADGRVLVAGGRDGSTEHASAEIFNPSDRHWTPAHAMNGARSQYPLVLLKSGQVLAVSGAVGAAYADSEVYDLGGDTWTPTGPMAGRRSLHTASLLSDGRVVVAGGFDGTLLGTTEIFQPTGATWSPVAQGLSETRAAHGAAVLDNGAVLVAGGCATAACTSARISTELFDPAANRWLQVMDMNRARVAFATVPLFDGTVLATAGENMTGVLLASSERFTLTSAGQSCTLGAECASAICVGNVCASRDAGAPDDGSPDVVFPDGGLPDAPIDIASDSVAEIAADAPPDASDASSDAPTPPIDSKDTPDTNAAATSFYACALHGLSTRSTWGSRMIVLFFAFLVRRVRCTSRS